MSISKHCTQNICSPKNKDLWYKDTYNLITWEIAYPYYKIPSSPTLSIYFYYQENYQYYHTFNYTNININDGFHVIYINDSFFPNNNELNKKWEYMVIIVGNSTNPDEEINNIFSNFPKVEFNIIQNMTTLPTSISIQSSTSNIIPTSSEKSINNENLNYNYKNNNVETWKIIVITICLILLFLIIFLGIWIYRKKRFLKNTMEYEESINISIIYEKPDLKEINDIKKVNYQKPNQID